MRAHASISKYLPVLLCIDVRLNPIWYEAIVLYFFFGLGRLSKVCRACINVKINISLNLLLFVTVSVIVFLLPFDRIAKLPVTAHFHVFLSCCCCFFTSLHCYGFIFTFWTAKVSIVVVVTLKRRISSKTKRKTQKIKKNDSEQKKHNNR